MKKLLYAILPILLACISCSDDDWTQKDDIKRNLYQGKSLEATLNDSTLLGRSVLFTTSDAVKYDITLNKAIPGEDQILFSGVTLRDSIGYQKFENLKFDSKDQSVTISGEITPDNLLKIDIKYIILNQDILAVPKWKLSGLDIRVIPQSATDSIDLKGFMGENKIPVLKSDPESKDNDLQLVYQSIGALVPIMLTLHAEMHEDAYMSFSWKSNIPSMIPLEAGSYGEGMIRYGMKDNTIYPALTIPIDNMLNGLKIDDIASLIGSGDSGLLGNIDIKELDLPVLIGLIQKAYTGLPLNVEFYTGGTATRPKKKMDIIITREMMLPYVDMFSKLIVPMIEGLDTGDLGAMFGFTGPGMANFVSESCRVIKESKEFDLKLQFTQP